MMERPEWAAGSEERFSDFMRDLTGAERIALVSHTDHDGIAAAKVAQDAVSAQEIFFIDYSDMDEHFIEKLRENRVTHVVMLDLMVKDSGFLERLGEFAKVLLIDHHTPEHDFNSARVVYMNAEGMCATYLAYYLFSKIKNLEARDWLVACACIADWCYLKNQGWMAHTIEKYGERFVPTPEGVKKTGKFWDVQAAISLALVYFDSNLRRVFDSIGMSFGEIGDLGNYAGEVQEEIDACIARYEGEKQAIDGGFFWEFTSRFQVKSIVTTTISAERPDTTIIIGKLDGERYYFSARRQDKKISMNDLLKKLIMGFTESNAGGHAAAAGGHIRLADVSEFKRRLGVR